MAYVTLKEAAKKYNLSPALTERFVEVAETQFPHLVFGNPDISATGMDAHIVKADSLMSMIRATITPKDTITSADEINALRLKALEAMSTYVAEYNKINYVDFITDMRLEADFTPNECPRSGFGVDSEELTEFFENTMAEDICERLTTLQR